MNNKRKIVMYFLSVFLLNIAITILTVFNSIDSHFSDNERALFIFACAFWIVSLLALLLHMRVIFDRFYDKMAGLVNHATPEFFGSSHEVLPKTKAYNRLKYITIILLFLVILLQGIVCFL